LSVDESRRDMAPNFLYLYRTFNTLFRGANELFQPGWRAELPEVSVDLLSVDSDGFPSEVRFDFTVPLEDASLHWLQWNWRPTGFGSYSPFPIPALGETITLAGPL
jgi:hypothetical protein